MNLSSWWNKSGSKSCWLNNTNKYLLFVTISHVSMRLLIFNVKEKERKLGLRSGHAYIVTIHVHTHPAILRVLALSCKRQCHFKPVKTELFRKSFQSKNFCIYMLTRKNRFWCSWRHFVFSKTTKENSGLFWKRKACGGSRSALLLLAGRSWSIQLCPEALRSLHIDNTLGKQMAFAHLSGVIGVKAGRVHISVTSSAAAAFKVKKCAAIRRPANASTWPTSMTRLPLRI